MICQQLTTVYIVMTTYYKIASGQLSFSQRLALSRNYPRSMLNHGVLRRPPFGYHFETRRHISNTYPRNSYKIRYGLSNVVRNNNRGSSSPSKGGKRNPKKKKSDDVDDGETPDDTSPPATSPPAGSPTAESPPEGSPPAANPAPPGGQSAP
ncbi:uncharacterized protein LOC100573905 [Acyrthosiphon pisum]|uniref:Uncharacterized protein n=1 Tax=Acyrthosiphon pisum TaxID=7029 RepID=A0A8R2AD65_ACYPI|nr:uncharacterized protein LOC100573905 [Acyrthosiphon pisum]|eukprot:XP_003247643.1 PREDICTED: uncharacterized protein LOC100573905 [Acyrthosiphon pisum]